MNANKARSNFAFIRVDWRLNKNLSERLLNQALFITLLAQETRRQEVVAAIRSGSGLDTRSY